MDRKIIAAAAILGFVAIILGAFGAHALKKVLDVEQLVSFETGVRYQMYHALFLLFLGTTKLVSDKTKSTIYYLVISGVLFFSGSIYLLATRNITNVDFSVIGFITPIGGLLMIIAWALLFLNILKQKA
ncbi:DUF423 domain-containing protein [Flavobacterium lindanitolerans]|jgi:uncharacterized membrane protein YgdD (TMEM256/DUF423 family)|uniref:Uncharacterized membrane protein YgdD (TMEM256/DUF423 family) n=1 Tax=Flavobacterium lindanitolerans TaxID=428988 RepID=A0A497V0Z9_9FLAO|nr:DUF423 domain-containing protein [Flavobacterium lindanitolerans]MBL7868322.1 DUF423 domain-containing protein [Flavobacterium lindanitolerans]PKW28628.1 uncharacterized membrane protein YgdD (TMEM256/DUF423 family) [Flavobacterium lindanitolerans]RLJ35867.1 uncharacterized membrane protein YgdD (TMEM256/DUF423 family) [Flavobacterium lindanitolerans]